MKFSALIFLSAAMLMMGPSVRANENCGADFGNTDCDENEMPMVTQPPIGGGCEVECPAPNSPPPEPILECTKDGLKHSCGIWPRGPSLSYRWDPSDEVAFSIPSVTSLHYQTITCLEPGGKVQVGLTVVTRFGLTSTRRFNIDCTIEESGAEHDPIFQPEPVPEPEQGDF